MKDIIITLAEDICDAFNHNFDELADNGIIPWMYFSIRSDDVDEIAFDAINTALCDRDAETILKLADILNYLGEYRTSLHMCYMYADDLIAYDAMGLNEIVSEFEKVAAAC